MLLRAIGEVVSGIWPLCHAFLLKDYTGLFLSLLMAHSWEIPFK